MYLNSTSRLFSICLIYSNLLIHLFLILPLLFPSSSPHTSTNVCLFTVAWLASPAARHASVRCRWDAIWVTIRAATGKRRAIWGKQILMQYCILIARSTCATYPAMSLHSIYWPFLVTFDLPLLCGYFQSELTSRQNVERDLLAERTRILDLQTLLDKLATPVNAEDEAVDKTLITNLFVSYFHTNKYVDKWWKQQLLLYTSRCHVYWFLLLSYPARPSERSHDVLNLIGKILSFSDEQLKIVGLKDRPMSMLDSLLSSVLPFAPEVLQLSSNV